jgi:hypothetical protein
MACPDSATAESCVEAAKQAKNKKKKKNISSFFFKKN